jgi:hypothetical protein
MLTTSRITDQAKIWSQHRTQSPDERNTMNTKPLNTIDGPGTTVVIWCSAANAARFRELSPGKTLGEAVMYAAFWGLAELETKKVTP